MSDLPSASTSNALAGRVSDAPVGLLFVCLGNICRSPTAEAVMHKLIQERGLSQRVYVDSAGTGHWHVGEAPDRRAASAALARGVTLAGTAREVRRDDFERFDLLLAMDEGNLRDLRALAPDEAGAAKVKLLRAFDPASPPDATPADLAVPDPYYGGVDGFERVLDLVQAACEGLLQSLRLNGTT